MPTSFVKATAEGMPSRRRFLKTALAGTAAAAAGVAAVGVAHAAAPSGMARRIAAHRARWVASEQAIEKMVKAEQALFDAFQKRQDELHPEVSILSLESRGPVEILREVSPVTTAQEVVIRDVYAGLVRKREELGLDRLSAEHDATWARTSRAFKRLLRHRPDDLDEVQLRSAYLLDLMREMDLDEEEVRWLVRSTALA